MTTLISTLTRLLADLVARVVADWRRDQAIRNTGKQEAQIDAAHDSAARQTRAARAVDAVRHGGDFADRVRDRFRRG